MFGHEEARGIRAAGGLVSADCRLDGVGPKGVSPDRLREGDLIFGRGGQEGGHQTVAASGIGQRSLPQGYAGQNIDVEAQRSLNIRHRHAREGGGLLDRGFDEVNAPLDKPRGDGCPFTDTEVAMSKLTTSEADDLTATRRAV